MMAQTTQKFFLAANSGKGFVSRFRENYDIADGWRAFLLKGGPGTGKSSFMKHFAFHATAAGKETVLCPCSSDPASLDGVILPREKLILLDATAPHTVEPQLPGVCENLIDLGRFWDAEKLRRNAEPILAVTAENKRCHRRAAGHLAVAGKIAAGGAAMTDSLVDRRRVIAFSERLCHRLLPAKHHKTPREFPRFLQGVTPLGIMDYGDSLLPFYREKIVLEDPFGGVRQIFAEAVRDFALRAGYAVITLYNPILPERIDHVLIPERSLAFLTEQKPLRFDTPERRVHARRFYDIPALHACRERLRFDRRVTEELLREAARSLADAKRVHDRLEQYYSAAMDFPALTEFAENFTGKILA